MGEKKSSEDTLDGWLHNVTVTYPAQRLHQATVNPRLPEMEYNVIDNTEVCWLCEMEYNPDDSTDPGPNLRKVRSQFALLSCSHHLCLVHFRDYIENKITDVTITCPHDGCTSEIQVQEIKSYMEE